MRVTTFVTLRAFTVLVSIRRSSRTSRQPGSFCPVTVGALTGAGFRVLAFRDLHPSQPCDRVEHPPQAHQDCACSVDEIGTQKLGCLVEAYGKGAYGESEGGEEGKKGRYVFTPDIWAKKTRITKYAKPACIAEGKNQVNTNTASMR